MICLSAGLTGWGCLHRPLLVLPADKVVVPLPAYQAYTPEFDGYFVPKARMLDILNRLSEKEIFDK
jgi:hypothetical protein